MSLYADICRNHAGDETDIVFDTATSTWTVVAMTAFGIDPIPGIADKELALAIARALWAAYSEGGYAAGYS